MINKGSYLLLLFLEKEKVLQVGKLGTFTFQKGWYCYVGSAMNNLQARIERHLKIEKKLRWHIDCNTKTSWERTFSSISTMISPSLKRPTEALPSRTCRWAATARASLGLELPVKSIADSSNISILGATKQKNGWGARDRTWECGDQNPVPYRLATPQMISLFLVRIEYCSHSCLRSVTHTDGR